MGFYSAFIVADRVIVRTRRAGKNEADAVEWSSDGDGQYTIKSTEKSERGPRSADTERGRKEFGETYRIRHLVTKYSDHVSIHVLKMRSKKDDDSEAKPEWDQVNQATALWTRARTDITDDEYNEFYKHVAHDFEDPMTWSHHKVEGKSEYTGFSMCRRGRRLISGIERVHGFEAVCATRVYHGSCRRVLTLYLRFIRGVVDSSI